MNYLAIDVGIKNNGYALFEEGKYKESGTLVSQITPYFSEIYLFFKHYIINKDIDIIIYEDPQSFINKNIAKSLLKVAGMYEALAIEFNCLCYCYNPTTVKKIITNDGKSNKKEIELQVKKLLSVDNIELSGKHSNHDIDAIAIGYTHFLQTKIKNY